MLQVCCFERKYTLSLFSKLLQYSNQAHSSGCFLFLTPSFSWLQTTYWKKVSKTAFKQILPKILPVVHIFSFIIMTYLKKFNRIKSLITEQCPVELYPYIIPTVSPILPKMFPILLSCFLPPPCTDCPAYCPKPTVWGKPCRWGKNPAQQQKKAHFLHQKNLPHQIVASM